MRLQCFLVITIFLCCGKLVDVGGEVNQENDNTEEPLNFYSFPVMDITENIISLEEYKGKVSLVVNVASQCGYTDNHYKMLNLLQKIFEETDKFAVLAFPCNQFGGQEPGTHRDIIDFAYQKMGATFPLFAKVNVIDQNVNPAWRFLIKESGHVPNWNFWKYLVDHNGHVIKAWGPSVSPDQLYPNVKDAVDKATEADPKKQQEQKTEGKKTMKDKTEKDEF